jgi:hypothetical protein
MMGFQGTPARLFYDFCLDEHIPSDHMLGGIDRRLDLDDRRLEFFNAIPRLSPPPRAKTGHSTA